MSSDKDMPAAVFAAEKQAYYRVSFPGLDDDEVASEIRNLWASADDEEKEHYVREAIRDPLTEVQRRELTPYTDFPPRILIDAKKILGGPIEVYATSDGLILNRESFEKWREFAILKFIKTHGLDTFMLAFTNIELERANVNGNFITGAEDLFGVDEDADEDQELGEDKMKDLEEAYRQAQNDMHVAFFRKHANSFSPKVVANVLASLFTTGQDFTDKLAEYEDL